MLVASSGGHLLELVQLRDEWESNDRAWVTFPTTDAITLLEGELVDYAYYPTNRNLKNLVRNVFVAFRVVATRRPRAIVTTGAGVAVPFCYVGRLFGARVVFIESFARVSSPSMTARLVHPIASAFFVQWPDMLQHFPRGRYEGQLF